MQPLNSQTPEELPDALHSIIPVSESEPEQFIVPLFSFVPEQEITSSDDTQLLGSDVNKELKS
tara:strand:+ start:450 stop:638 length:189 start_codon:yes stop_codon:yes gene_type:complete